MASTTVNVCRRNLFVGCVLTSVQVVRYTALLGGVFYGIAHRRSLQKAHDADVKSHAIHEREHLIAEAKEAWKKKQESPKGGGESLFLLITVLFLPVFWDPSIVHRLRPSVGHASLGVMSCSPFPNSYHQP